MVLSSLLPEKKSPVQGIPVIPGGTLWSGHLHLLQEPDFEVALHKWTVEHADQQGRCTFWMGPTTPSLSVRHPADVQFLLKATAHRSTFPLLAQHFVKLFGPHNVGLLNGKEWKQQRAKIAKALHSSHVVKHHETAFQQATHNLVDTILYEHDGLWECSDALSLLKGLTLDCFGQAAFHVNFGSCQHLLSTNNGSDTTAKSASQIGPAFDRLTKEMMRRVTKDVLVPTSHMYSLPTAANKDYNTDKELVLEFLTEIVQERQRLLEEREEKPPSDLLTGFLEHFHDNNNNINNNKEVALVMAQSIMGLLFGGYETSSVTLTYCLYLLSQHPKVLEKCLEELDNSNSNNNNNDDDDDDDDESPQYPYLNAVVKETLRLYPPAISTNRGSDRDLELPPQKEGDPTIVIPKGTYLYVPIWIIQRDETNYDNPLAFNPERWVSQSDNHKTWKERKDLSNNSRQAWIPFSAGARACPGQHFAMQEMTTILSVLLPALQFTPPKDYILTPHRDGFVQVPKGGIPMTITKRK